MLPRKPWLGNQEPLPRHFWVGWFFGNSAVNLPLWNVSFACSDFLGFPSWGWLDWEDWEEVAGWWSFSKFKDSFCLCPGDTMPTLCSSSSSDSVIAVSRSSNPASRKLSKYWDKSSLDKNASRLSSIAVTCSVNCIYLWTRDKNMFCRTIKLQCFHSYQLSKHWSLIEQQKKNFKVCPSILWRCLAFSSISDLSVFDLIWFWWFFSSLLSFVQLNIEWIEPHCLATCISLSIVFQIYLWQPYQMKQRQVFYRLPTAGRIMLV